MEYKNQLKRIYTITEKGDKVLAYLKKVNKIMDPDIIEISI